MRVVAHTCSNTEIVCALGRGDWLVGVDDHSDHPPEVVSALPRIGPDLDVDVERVLALEPDLVITSLTVPGHERCLERLEAAGLPLLVTRPQSLDAVYQDILRIAESLQAVDRGEALVASMREALAPRPAPWARPTVLVEWWPKPVIVPGRLSWANDLIERAGGANPLGRREVESTPVSDEEVIGFEPDAVVIAWCGVPFDKYRPEVVRRRSAWRDLPALREDRIHCISEAWLGRPGPRLVEGYRALCEVVDQCLGSP